MRRVLLAIGVCAVMGLAGGIGYAALTQPPFTAKALVLLRPGAAMPGLAQAGVQRVTSTIVSISAQGETAAQAVSADAAAVRSYLASARASRAQLLDEVAIVPHQGGRAASVRRARRSRGRAGGCPWRSKRPNHRPRQASLGPGCPGRSRPA